MTNADGSTFEVGSPTTAVPWTGDSPTDGHTPRVAPLRNDSWDSSRDSLLGHSPAGALAHSASEVQVVSMVRITTFVINNRA